jgi:hypothetical protein
MIIAQKKRKENIVEYLLYMWYVEDLIRANGFDTDKIRQTLVSAYDTPEDIRESIAQWYEDLAAMMRAEGVKEKGHIQMTAAVKMALDDLHLRLLAEPGESYYRMVYHNVLPLIVQLRAKAAPDESQTEIDTCLTAIYGYSILKLKDSEISETTSDGIRRIASFLSLLAEKYREEQARK